MAAKRTAELAVETPPVEAPVEPVPGPGDVARLTPEQQAETNTKPMEPPRGGVPITETPPRWHPWFVAGHVTEYEFRDLHGTREFRVKPTGVAAAHTRVPNAETGKMEYFDEAGERIEVPGPAPVNPPPVAPGQFPE